VNTGVGVGNGGVGVIWEPNGNVQEVASIKTNREKTILVLILFSLSSTHLTEWTNGLVFLYLLADFVLIEKAKVAEDLLQRL
jgi:hypothetical protein